MYQLTLTKTERDAIDWVGYRYFSGDDFRLLLEGEGVCINHEFDLDSDEHYWNQTIDITFDIPENVAWEIKEELEAEDSFCPCFSPELTVKMREFCDKIV